MTTPEPPGRPARILIAHDYGREAVPDTGTDAEGTRPDAPAPAAEPAPEYVAAAHPICLAHGCQVAELEDRLRIAAQELRNAQMTLERQVSRAVRAEEALAALERRVGAVAGSGATPTPAPPESPPDRPEPPKPRGTGTTRNAARD